MSIKTRLCVATVAVLLGASPALATVYDIGGPVGTDGSYSGWIETDGVQGAVNFSDIIGWDITINGGGPPNLELIGPQIQR